MPRKQLKFFKSLPLSSTVLQFFWHTGGDKKQALVLLAALLLTACHQPNNTEQEAAGASVPFSIEEIPTDAPVRHVSVRFPLDWESRTIAVREYKGFLIYDDIILGRVDEVPKADETTFHTQSATSGAVWQNKTITYTIRDLPDPLVARIRAAADYYNNNTVVRWAEADGGTDGGAAHMVEFFSNGVRDAGVSNGVTNPHSTLGIIDGASIRLSDGASVSTVRHEMLHALGFSHEQKRPDRNTYLDVADAGSDAGSDSVVNYDLQPIGHYDFVSKVHYDYDSNPTHSGYFVFSLRGEDNVHTLFQREVQKYNDLSTAPDTSPATVQKYVGKGDNLSYLDIYALKLKYTVSNASRPFTVTAAEEINQSLIEAAKLTSSSQKLLRLSITNNSGFDAESWALRIQFGSTALPVRLAPKKAGEHIDGFLTTNIVDPNKPSAGRTEIITPIEGNSHIANGKTLFVYVVMEMGANGRLNDIAFCRLNSFDCLNSGP